MWHSVVSVGWGRGGRGCFKKGFYGENTNSFSVLAEKWLKARKPVTEKKF